MYVLSCPHCKRRIETTHHPVNYGNPIKNCPRCGKIYIDPYCTEPALRPYKPRSVLHQLEIGASGALLLALAVGLIVYFLSDNNATTWISVGITFLVCTPLCFLWCLLTQKKSEKWRIKCWQESDRRLRDPKHAAALKFYGYNVPPKYLPSGYWKDRDTLTYQGAIVETSSSLGKKKNLKPHMPSGSEYY